MAEEDSAQEKTEEPSARKLQKARDQGQVPRSKELNTSAVLMAGALSILIFGNFMSQGMEDIFRHHFSLERETLFDPGLMFRYLADSIYHAGFLLVPFMLVVLIASIIGPIGLGGWLVSADAITPKFSRINPIKGLKKMFSVKSLIELLKAWAKVLVVGGFSVLVFWFYADDMWMMLHQPIRLSIENMAYIVAIAVLILSASTIIITVVDIPLQVHQFTKQMRMTKQEVKEEYKDTEGKPEVKSRVRQLQREIAQRSMLGNVPEADVVITNPTHYSIALKYDTSTKDAPFVVAKGADFMALKIREIGREHQVPIVESAALARSLYNTTEVDQEIPEGLYLAVAQVLAYIYQINEYKAHRAAKPGPMPEVPIPEDLRYD